VKAEPPTTDLGAKEAKETNPRAQAQERIRARHVLIQWIGATRAEKNVVRSKDQALALAKEIAQRAHGGEDLGRLATEYSDEPGAASRGGSLGNFPRGQMVKEFDEVAFRLAPGQISDVVETGFGYHVIQRIE
jgi:parvulin-like peptidyl-prolyl isomerase